MKILILGFSKIKYMPYLDFYLNCIDCKKNKVSVVYWNRDQKNEPIPYKNVRFFEFNEEMRDDKTKILKIKSFIKYHFFVNKILKNNTYDRIIILHSLPGILNLWKFITKYKNKYLFDFRDITYEKNHIYRFLIGLLVKNSIFTSTSSDGFRFFLPKAYNYKIYTNHNIIRDSLLHRKATFRDDRSIIRMAFWGFVRELNINKQIIKNVSRDYRFELHFYGREFRTSYNLKKYAQEIGAKNVFFHGEYSPNERYKFIEDIDLVLNIYAESTNMMLALTNKFYDGLIFYRPQICMSGSYMGKIVQKNEIGFVCNPYKKDFLNDVYQYYKQIDKSIFFQKCDFCLRKCLKEMDFIKKEIKNKFKI